MTSRVAGWLVVGLLGGVIAVGCGSDSKPANTGGAGSSSGGQAGSGASAGTAGNAGSASGGTAGSSSGGSGGIDTSPLGGDRPVSPTVPSSYDPAKPAPLIILLHGFGASGLAQDFIFGMAGMSEEFGYIFLAPDGTVGPEDKRFWNASEFCCDFGNLKPDDVGYIEGLITEAKGRYNIDPKRVFLAGHSNGGFMSHRFACDRSSQVAAFASLAGAQQTDPADCKPSEAVSALQIHGTVDSTIKYDGEATYPSADVSQMTWADRNGCTGTALTATGETKDYVEDPAGEETEILKVDGCPTGGAVELWKMNDVGHIPFPNPAWKRAVVEWLLAHPKP